MKKLIVCTDFAGAHEQIVDGVNGIVVKTFSPNAIAEAILSVCTNPLLKSNLQKGIEQVSIQNGWDAILAAVNGEK